MSHTQDDFITEGSATIGPLGDIMLSHDGTDAKLDTDGNAASDLVIDCGAGKTVELTRTVWDDLRVPLNAGKTGASRPPTWAKFKDDGAGSVGVYAWSFGDEAVNEEQLWFEVQLPHEYKLGTNLCPHIHWSPAVSGAAGEFVKWGLEYVLADINGSFGASAIIVTDASAAAAATSSGDATMTADKHYLTAFPEIVGSGIAGVSAMLACRLFRNSGHADDDLAQAAFALEFDFHYQIDTMGSRTETAK